MSAITIRAMEPADIPAYSRIFNHPEVVRDSLEPPFVSEHERQDSMTYSPSSRSLVAELDGTVIGFGNLRILPERRSHAATVTLGVYPEPTDSVAETVMLQSLIDLGEDWYGVRRFETKVFVENRRAVELFERSGFEIEATHRQYAIRDGEYADAYSMARLHE